MHSFSLRTFPLLALAAALLAACSTPAPTPKVMTVSHEVLTHVVKFDGRSLTLATDEYQSLGVFAHAVPASAISFVYVNTDEKHPLNVKRAQRIKAFLVKEGIDQDAVHLLRVTTDDKHSVTVVLEYTQGVPPKHCPDWSKNALTNYDNTNSSNFGCAYDADIAAQLADPEDYVRGHGTPTYDATRDSMAIQKYETGASASASGSSSGAAAAPAASASSSSGTTSTPQ